MLVTTRSTTSPAGGRELLGRLNRGILQELFGERLVVVELEKPEPGSQSLAAGLRGHIDGLSPAVIAAALDIIREKRVELVFLDGSNLGELAAAIKAQAPGVAVCTFFHNVEARFFWGSLKQRRSPRALAVLAANYLAERKAVRHSDTIITLTARDSRGLQRLYGRAATHISAMAIDEPVATRGVPAAGKGPPYALFVGGTFYANRAGIGWFAEHVAPRIAMKTCVVGHGFEAFRQELERPGKVAVIGGVDDLRQWYEGAQVVIAPIFDGSGMKTKVAEALMYGKKIVGTPEAFVGYEDVAGIAGWQCGTADEFVAGLAEAEALDLPGFDPALRALFDARFSREAARTRMAAILGMPLLERTVR